MAEPKVYIILLNWNGWRDTLECLDSLEKLEYSNYEVMVIDNASTDGSVSKIREQFPRQTILKSEKNLGYAGGNNIGIRHAMEQNADYIWILNNDTVVDSKALSKLVVKMENDRSLGMCGCRLVYYHQKDTLQAFGGGVYKKWTGTTCHIGEDKATKADCNEQEIERKMDYVIGASIFVSKEFIQEVGLLDEDYFLYYEELDWAMRSKGRFKIGIASESIVYHKEGASTKGTSRQLNTKSRISDYYQIKNRLKFSWKYFPYFFPFVYLTTIYAIINRMKRKQWDRIPMIMKLFFTFNK